MSVKVNFLILCEAVHIEEQTQKVTLSNIFDNIHTSSLPFTHERFVVAFKITVPLSECEADKIRLTIEVLSPTNKRIVKATAKQAIEEQYKVGDKFQFTSLCDFENSVEFTEAGQHTIRFSVNEEFAEEIFFNTTYKKSKEGK